MYKKFCTTNGKNCIILSVLLGIITFITIMCLLKCNVINFHFFELTLAFSIAINIILINLMAMFRRNGLIDSKTGLKTCKSFKKSVQKNMSRKRYFSMFVIDLNKFKQVNDVYGHPVGDNLLIEFAKSLSKELPKEAVLYRIGGDEFAIIATGIHSRVQKLEMINIVNRIQGKEIDVGNETKIKIEFSIGVATYPTDSEENDELYDIADQAMYLAKKRTYSNEGENFTIYEKDA